MSDFDNPPTFGAPLITRAGALAALRVLSEGRASAVGLGFDPSYGQPTSGGQLGPPAEYSIDAVPWGYGLVCATVYGQPDPDQHPPPDPVPAAQATLDLAESNLADAQAAQAAAAAALASAQAVFVERAETVAAAQCEANKADINLRVLTARQAPSADIVAANARIVSAQADLAAANIAAATASTAMSAAQATSDGADAAVYSTASLVIVAEKGLAFAEWSGGLPVPTADTDRSMVIYETSFVGPGLDLAYNSAGGSPRFDQTTGALVGFLYENEAAHAQYRHTLLIDDDTYQALLPRPLRVVYTWLEVTASYTTVADANGMQTVDGVEPSFTRTPMSETFDLAGAAQLGNGDWAVVGSVHELAAPDIGTASAPPSVISQTGIATAVTLPTVSAEIQTQGAERFRQGWPEFLTQPEANPRRYLNMTASNGPGTPEGKGYAGSLLFELPPAGYGEEGYDYSQIVDCSFAPPRRPLLLVKSGITADVPRPSGSPPFPLPDDGSAPVDGAAVVSAIERTMASPTGLRWTLSNEQTPDSILTDAQSVRDGAWPESSVAPTTAFRGAINYQSAHGDHAVAQKMRLKLTYAANDSRSVEGETFQVTCAWSYRRRNLDTGHVTSELHSITKTFPVTVTASNPDGTTTTTYHLTATDTDWTEITAEANESVEFVALPGENADPHTYAQNFSAGTGNPNLSFAGG